MPGRARSQTSRTFGYSGLSPTPIFRRRFAGGKLEVTSIKCRLIGWWADETKGYRLEDAETGKLITARDVRFVENDAPGDLAVIETRGNAPTRAEIDALGPPKIEKAAGTANPIVPSPLRLSLQRRRPLRPLTPSSSK